MMCVMSSSFAISVSLKWISYFINIEWCSFLLLSICRLHSFKSDFHLCFSSPLLSFVTITSLYYYIVELYQFNETLCLHFQIFLLNCCGLFKMIFIIAFRIISTDISHSFICFLYMILVLYPRSIQVCGGDISVN